MQGGGRVKRGLDRFVPDTVRRVIEENPDAPALQKVPKDVTVLFVDIELFLGLPGRHPGRRRRHQRNRG